jgi:hypothetical protein
MYLHTFQFNNASEIKHTSQNNAIGKLLYIKNNLISKPEMI